MATQSVMPFERRSIPRSVRAVLVGFLAVAAISIATDQLFHVLDVFPPWGQPMPDPGDNALALSYRTLYSVLGGYIAARLAPASPLRHALALGFLGVLFSILGAVAMIGYGPLWYPVALIVVALPATALGGVIYQKVMAASR